MDGRTDRQTDRHKATDAHRHRYRHRDKDAETETQRHTHTATHTETHTHTHTHTETHTHRDTYRGKHTETHTHTHRATHRDRQTYTDTHTHTRTTHARLSFHVQDQSTVANCLALKHRHFSTLLWFYIFSVNAPPKRVATWFCRPLPPSPTTSHSLPEFRNFKLFGKTTFYGCCFWPVHSETKFTNMSSALFMPTSKTQTLLKGRIGYLSGY